MSADIITTWDSSQKFLTKPKRDGTDIPLFDKFLNSPILLSIEATFPDSLTLLTPHPPRRSRFTHDKVGDGFSFAVSKGHTKHSAEQRVDWGHSSETARKEDYKETRRGGERERGARQLGPALQATEPLAPPRSAHGHKPASKNCAGR